MKIRELEYKEDVFDLFSEMTEKAEKEGFTKGIIININDITVSRAMKDSCKYCSSHNNNYSCPSYSLNEENVKNLIKKYENALMLVLRVSAPKWLTNIPVAGDYFKKYLILQNARKMHRMILELQKQAINKGYISDGFIAGKCLIHTKCGKVKGEKCKSPAERRYSMESLGIDVFSLSKKYGLKLLNKLDNKFYYIGLLLANMKEAAAKKTTILEINLENISVEIPQLFDDLHIENIIKRLKIKYAQGTLIIAKNSNNNGIGLDKLIEIMRTSSAVADYGYVRSKSSNIPKHGVYVFIKEFSDIRQ